MAPRCGSASRRSSASRWSNGCARSSWSPGTKRSARARAAGGRTTSTTARKRASRLQAPRAGRAHSLLPGSALLAHHGAGDQPGRTTMEFRDTPEEAAFRAEVRRFIERELPESLRHIEPEWGSFNTRTRRGTNIEAQRAWRRSLAERHWIAPHWPKEYGGAGLDIGRQFIFNEEMALHRGPGVGGIGVGWAGPTIMVYGTQEQKDRFLPRILSGDETWCQG